MLALRTKRDNFASPAKAGALLPMGSKEHCIIWKAAIGYTHTAREQGFPLENKARPQPTGTISERSVRLYRDQNASV